MPKKAETLIVERILAEYRKRGAFAEKLHGDGMQRAGLPDILACYRGRYLLIEVKTPDGELSDAQKQVIAEINKAQQLVYVVVSVAQAMAILDRHDKLIDRFGNTAFETIIVNEEHNHV